jgi:hypothetical protein
MVALLVRWLLRPACWVLGHDWARGVISFGHTLARCRRCAAVRYL